MSIEKLTLGELCTIEKGSTGILKAIPGDYPLVVTGEERKSHNQFQFEGEAVIIPLVSGTGHGHASIKRIHFQSGKFALGSILCAVIPKDKSKLNAEYLYYFLDLNRENELVARMRGMANVTLPMKEIAKIEIPLPSLDDQIQFVKMYKLLGEKSNYLSIELSHQLDLLKKLRQQLLQDAVQGKLVEQDPHDEPASVLIQKIKVHKELLTKNKKPKKEKEEPQIKSEEISFEIPENWVWCRLRNIANLKSGNQYEYPIAKKGIMFIKVGDMNLPGNEQEILFSSTYFNNGAIKKTDLIEPCCIIFPKRGGAIATNKRRMILKESVLIDSNTMAVAPSNVIHFRYFFHWFSGVDLSKFGNNGVIPQVNNKDLEPLLIPLPPISEQYRIVQKIEHLMKICDALEVSIKQSQQQNEQLSQQFLKEALTKGIKQEEQLVEPTHDVELKSDDRCKALLLAAEIIWQLNQKQTLGHIKLQKLIYLCNCTKKMNLPVNFLKWAMGPYDPELQKYIDTALVEKEWFKYDEDSSLKYQPLKRAGGHKEDFDKYFESDKSAINHLIQLFENAKSARIEIVATLFACWEELIVKNQLVNDNALLAKFYDWSDKKKKYTTEKVIDALRWMENEGITPS